MGNPSGSPSMGDLLNGMKQLTQSGIRENGDFRLTPAAATNYLQVIGTFKKALERYRDQAADLTAYGNPGGFKSATWTIENLKDAVTDANDGIVANLDGYITYLDELEKTVNATLRRFQAEDNG